MKKLEDGIHDLATWIYNSYRENVPRPIRWALNPVAAIVFTLGAMIVLAPVLFVAIFMDLYDD